MISLTAYLDESGTHRGCPLTLMAGYVGRTARWAQFDRRWREILRKRALSYLHTKDLVQGTGEFDNLRKWPISRRERLVAKAGGLPEKHAMFGMTVFLRDDDYEQIFAHPMKRKPRKFRFDTKYGVCFRVFLTRVFETLEIMAIPLAELSLHLVLEEGHRNAGDVTRIVREVFKRYAPQDQATAVKSVEFKRKKDVPGLQAADFLAYSSLHIELRQGADISPTRISETKAPRRNETCKIHRIALGIANLEELRDNILTADDQRIAWGKRRARVQRES